MQEKEVPRQIGRSCLVCGVTTRIAHLGIGCCRACAVFYRRYRQHDDLICRAGHRQCATVLTCKRCRFDRIATLMQHSSVDIPSQSNNVTISVEKGIDPNAFCTLLDRANTQYNVMSFTRLTSELISRPSPPHPLEISLDHGPFFPADFALVMTAIRLMLTATIEFGRTTFPEFAGLRPAEKWMLATNFFYRFRMFEGCYRSNKFFANDAEKHFVTYTTYFSLPYDEQFFVTAPPGADIAGAIRFTQDGELARNFKDRREMLTRVNPSEREFLALAVLMFWTISGLSVSDDIARTGDKYRGAILHELHAYYRHELGLVDYAARMGELMLLIQVFERTKELKEHFEMLRLYDIMTEDNFIYRLKDLAIR